jgi:hypothetical protein
MIRVHDRPGKVLRNVNKHKYALLDQVIDLVTEPNALMRVTEIEILEVLVKVVANELID